MKRKKKGLWGSVCEAQRTQTLSLYFLVLNFVHCVLRFALPAWFSCAAPPRTLSSPMPPPGEIGMALSRCNWHQLNKHMHTGFWKPVALSVIDVILAVKSSDQLGSVIKSLSGRLPERSPTGFFFLPLSSGIASCTTINDDRKRAIASSSRSVEPTKSTRWIEMTSHFLIQRCLWFHQRYLKSPTDLQNLIPVWRQGCAEY